MTETFNNIWDALIDDPTEKQSCKIKSDLMIVVELFINENKLTQQAAADLMKTTQPKISNIVNGNIDKITIDLLVNMLAKIGKSVTVKVADPGIQRSQEKKTISQSFSLEEYFCSDDYFKIAEEPYTLTNDDWSSARAFRGELNEIAVAG